MKVVSKLSYLLVERTPNTPRSVIIQGAPVGAGVGWSHVGF